MCLVLFLVFQNRLADDIDHSIRALGGTVIATPASIRQLPTRSPLLQPAPLLELLHADLQGRPGDPQTLWQLGKLHHGLGNYFHAECYLVDCLASNEQAPETRQTVMELLIDSYQRIGDPYRAAEWTGQLNDTAAQRGQS